MPTDRTVRSGIPKRSDLPFGDALRPLMEHQDMTWRGLARATRNVDSRGLTHAYLNMLARGHDTPSERAMEIIASVFGIKPDYFAEYRLIKARRALDPTEVGLKRALANLENRKPPRGRKGIR